MLFLLYGRLRHYEYEQQGVCHYLQTIVIFLNKVLYTVVFSFPLLETFLELLSALSLLYLVSFHKTDPFFRKIIQEHRLQY